MPIGVGYKYTLLRTPSVIVIQRGAHTAKRSPACRPRYCSLRKRTNSAAMGVPYNRAAASRWSDAKELGRAAVATELLPALTGGRWIKSHAPEANWPTQRTPDRAPFDHARLYRRRGVRGRPTWANSLIVGQSYEWADPSAYAVAAGLAREGVSLWHAPQHSYWFPTRTTLVVAGRDIDPSRAAALGFRPVARERVQ